MTKLSSMSNRRKLKNSRRYLKVLCCPWVIGLRIITARLLKRVKYGRWETLMAFRMVLWNWLSTTTSMATLLSMERPASRWCASCMLIQIIQIMLLSFNIPSLQKMEYGMKKTRKCMFIIWQASSLLWCTTSPSKPTIPCWLMSLPMW